MPRPPVEPSPADAGPLPLRYLRATRLPFLSVTLFACLIGFGTAAQAGALQPGPALFTLALALVCHAAVNVLNDYYDALNGSDAANTERVFPYTGGSRCIQNGVLSLRQTRDFGFALLALTVLGGLALLARAPGLLGIGLIGVLAGWAYSAPPLALNARGLGEAAVALCFALVAVGADAVQRGVPAAGPLLAAAGYGVAVTAILYINQFPDWRADAAAGKRHWVVRLGPQRAAGLFVPLLAVAYALQALAILSGALPPLAAAVLGLLPLWRRAARELAAHAGAPGRLAAGIQATILAANLFGLLTAAALAFG